MNCSNGSIVGIKTSNGNTVNLILQIGEKQPSETTPSWCDRLGFDRQDWVHWITHRNHMSDYDIVCVCVCVCGFGMVYCCCYHWVHDDDDDDDDGDDVTLLYTEEAPPSDETSRTEALAVLAERVRNTLELSTRDLACNTERYSQNMHQTVGTPIHSSGHSYTHTHTHTHTHVRTNTHMRARKHTHTHTHTSATFSNF